MENIKILIIGSHDWIETVTPRLNAMHEQVLIEKIDDESLAVERLTHNSYNILLLQDVFASCNPIHLASMAYAMTRPSIIISNKFSRFIKFKMWHYFSKFSSIFKTSKKLINFNYGFKNLDSQIEKLSSDYMKYFEKVNAEIKKKVK